jgi:hypothetical protein
MGDAEGQRAAMKTLEEVAREIREGRERLAAAYEEARRRGRMVPVRPEELARLAELCSPQETETAPEGSSAAPKGSSSEHGWIRC